MNKQKNIENFSQTLKQGIWILGTSSWLFGISVREANAEGLSHARFFG